MIGINSIGTYLPKKRESNFDNLKKFEMNESFVREKIGFTKLAKKSITQETSDLCVQAWKNLKEKTDITSDKIDCVVVCTQNPDGFGIPHTSAIVHEKIKLSQSCATFDISLGCSGYIYGLSIIKSFMESNGLKIGLLFTADPYSKVIDNDDKKTATLFGDGATVTLMTSNPAFELGKFVFGSDGTKKEGIIIKDDGLIKMNGRAVFSFTVRIIPNNILEMLRVNNLDIKNIEKFFLHQGSLHIVNSIADNLGVPRSKCPFYSAEYGNTVSSSIPMILNHEFDNQDIKVAALSGFGVGLSWASTYILRKF